MWCFRNEFDVEQFLLTSEWSCVEDMWHQITLEYKYSNVLDLVPLKHLSRFGYKQFSLVEPWIFMYLSRERIESLTQEQLAVLSPQQVYYLDFQYLSPAQLASFSYVQISQKRMEQLNKLSILQLTPLLKTIISTPELSVIKELKD